MANTNSPLQSSKARRIKEFGEDISQLSLCTDISYPNISLLSVISQKVVSLFKVSYSFVENWIFGYKDGTDVVTHEGNSLKAHFKIYHGVHNTHNLGATATYSASVVDYVIKDYFREDQQTREDLIKWQVSEVFFRSIPQPVK
jgi:hypothetical protein